jgi:phosphinothricin acetyltransferase
MAMFASLLCCPEEYARTADLFQRPGRLHNPGMANPEIRLATEADLPAIEDIYNWYIPRSTCTYQEEIEPFEKRVAWYRHHGPRHPITVAELGGEVIGWGSLSEFRDRAAYRNTVEDSVYVRHDMHGRGIGSALLKDLIDRARALGHHTIIAGADGEQTVSIKLHAKFGFEPVAHFKQVGFKFDRWLDVVFLQLMLKDE